MKKNIVLLIFNVLFLYNILYTKTNVNLYPNKDTSDFEADLKTILTYINSNEKEKAVEKILNKIDDKNFKLTKNILYQLFEDYYLFEYDKVNLPVINKRIDDDRKKENEIEKYVESKLRQNKKLSDNLILFLQLSLYQEYGLRDKAINLASEIIDNYSNTDLYYIMHMRKIILERYYVKSPLKNMSIYWLEKNQILLNKFYEKNYYYEVACDLLLYKNNIIEQHKLLLEILASNTIPVITKIYAYNNYLNIKYSDIILKNEKQLFKKISSYYSYFFNKGETEVESKIEAYFESINNNTAISEEDKPTGYKKNN